MKPTHGLHGQNHNFEIENNDSPFWVKNSLFYFLQLIWPVKIPSYLKMPGIIYNSNSAITFIIFVYFQCLPFPIGLKRRVIGCPVQIYA